MKHVLTEHWVTDGVAYIPDWQGKVHKFKDMERAALFREKLLQQGPQRNKVDKFYVWQTMPATLTRRAFTFSHGRVKK